MNFNDQLPRKTWFMPQTWNNCRENRVLRSQSGTLIAAVSASKSSKTLLLIIMPFSRYLAQNHRPSALQITSGVDPHVRYAYPQQGQPTSFASMQRDPAQGFVRNSVRPFLFSLLTTEGWVWRSRGDPLSRSRCLWTLITLVRPINLISALEHNSQGNSTQTICQKLLSLESQDIQDQNRITFEIGQL
jgi:hypothetical protein